jgi:hypothetical protein
VVRRQVARERRACSILVHTTAVLLLQVPLSSLSTALLFRCAWLRIELACELIACLPAWCGWLLTCRGGAGQVFIDMAKVVRSEGVSGKDVVPHLNTHESLLTFLAEECNIRLLPFAAIKLQYKLTRPFAGSITPDVLVELVSTCGGASVVSPIACIALAFVGALTARSQPAVVTGCAGFPLSLNVSSSVYARTHALARCSATIRRGQCGAGRRAALERSHRRRHLRQPQQPRGPGGVLLHA